VLIRYGILGSFQFDPLQQWLVYTPFYALLVALFVRGRRAHQADVN
jgi:hypothetical protein